MPAYSDGWTFDPTAPHGGWIVEGASRFDDEIFHSAVDDLLVTWGDFHEVEYGNESVTYAVGIGNCSTPDDVKLYDVGNATQVSFVGAAHSSNYCEIIPDVPAAALAADLGNPCVDIDGSYCYPEGDDGCPLPHAASLCAVVVASNEHGLTSPRRRSSGVVLCDGSSLEVGTVHDLAAAGQHGDIDHTTSLAVAASWQGFSDGCAPIEDFTATLQEFVGGEWADAGVPVQTVGAHGAGNVDQPWSVNFTLPAAGRYRTQVCAINVVGGTRCAVSDGVVADETPPSSNGVVCVRSATAEVCGNATYPATPLMQLSGLRDGTLVYLPYASEDASDVVIEWGGCEDDESGIGGFRWCLDVVSQADETGHTVFSECFEKDWEDVGLAVQTPVAATHLTKGHAIMVNVECSNKAGLTTSATVGPVRFDRTPAVVSDSALTPPTLSAHDGLLWSSGSVAEIAVDTAEMIDGDTESGVASARLIVRDMAGAAVVDEAITSTC